MYALVVFDINLTTFWTLPTLTFPRNSWFLHIAKRIMEHVYTRVKHDFNELRTKKKKYTFRKPELRLRARLI